MIYEMSPVTTMLDSLLNVPLGECSSHSFWWMGPRPKKSFYFENLIQVFLADFSPFRFLPLPVFIIDVVADFFGVLCFGDGRSPEPEPELGMNRSLRSVPEVLRQQQDGGNELSVSLQAVQGGQLWWRWAKDLSSSPAWHLTFYHLLLRSSPRILPRCWASLSCDCFYKDTIVKYNPFLVVLLLNFLMSVVS